ncbi:MAG TPA: transaldolase family protein [Chlamydiales bacterium]|nr:transaldolase family protein [Chlamydiales bacterium]
MEIWLDTSDLNLVEQAKQMGILFGVTTNPSIVSKSKLGMEDLLEQLLKIQKGPVTAQVTAEKAPEMIQQGEALFRFSNRLLIKIPVTGEGLKAIYALSQNKIPVMATAVFDPNQVLLAASAGASYIAPYFSLICEDDIHGIEPLKAMLRLLHRYNFPSKLLAASLRNPEQVKECAEIGAHAVTLNEKVFNAFIEDHQLTRQAIDRFARDWKNAPKRKSLPL